MKFVSIAMILLMSSTMAFGQGGNRGRQYDREKLQAARIAFLSNRLELTPEKAKVFWPIFTEYEKEKSELSKKYGEQKRALFADGTRNISDENADKMLDIYLEQKQAELDLEKKYLGKFKEVLELRQVWRVIRFDSDFRRSIMQRVGRERRSEDKEEKQKNGG